MGHRSHWNEWRTVSGPHALVFLEANQPRQSLVDPGINQGFEPDYGFETGRRARRPEWIAAPRIPRTVQGVLSNAAGRPNGVGLLGRKLDRGAVSDALSWWGIIWSARPA